jgi:hypothetical protein
MGVPAGYSLAEPGFGFKQLGAQPKATSGGSGMLYGDALVWNNTTHRWDKVAGAGAVGRFGFCGNTTIITQSTNNLTGVVTYTRGAADADTTCSVVVSGRILRVSDGVIQPGNGVITTATSPLDKVKDYAASTDFDLIVGTYVLNITQHHDMDAPLPASADGDIIVIDVTEKQPVVTA